MLLRGLNYRTYCNSISIYSGDSRNISHSVHSGVYVNISALSRERRHFDN